MDILSTLSTGSLVVFCGRHAAREQATAAITGLALRGPVTVLDNGNRFQPYRVARLLRSGRVAMDDLVVRQRISKTVEEYRSLSPTARAARVLQEAGQSVAAGQNIRFIYTRGKPGVWPLGTGELDPRWVDVDRYLVLLEKSAESVLDVFGDSLTQRLIADYVQNPMFPQINKYYEFSLK